MSYKRNPFNLVVFFFQWLLKIFSKTIQATGSLQIKFILILYPNLQQSEHMGFLQLEDPCFNFLCLKILT